MTSFPAKIAASLLTFTLFFPSLSAKAQSEILENSTILDSQGIRAISVDDVELVFDCNGQRSSYRSGVSVIISKEGSFGLNSKMDSKDFESLIATLDYCLGKDMYDKVYHQAGDTYFFILTFSLQPLDVRSYIPRVEKRNSRIVSYSISNSLERRSLPLRYLSFEMVSSHVLDSDELLKRLARDRPKRW